MTELTDEEFDAANERGRIEMLTKPRALAANYDPASGLMTLALTNDCMFSFPPRRCQGLENASDHQLANVEIMGVGLGLGWDEIDAHLSVEGLLIGRFGSQRYMERLRADPANEERLMREPYKVNYGQAAE